MKLNIDTSRWKRHFAVPCALIDNYIKLADESALKVLLCLLSSDEPTDESIIAKTGISKQQFEDAVAFWTQMGVITDENKQVAEASPIATPVVTEKVVHSSYSRGDIADMLKTDASMKTLFIEAEKTLGRILKHYDHEMLIILRDSYRFSEPAIILILEHCVSIGHDSARYIETVAKSMFEQGITDYKQLEEEFNRLAEYHSFENEVKRALGISIKLTSKQNAYVKKWKEAGYSIEMIALAGERCIDATGKVAFPYIDKVLENWANKNITTPEQAENENNPAEASKERSFDLSEFDDFTLGNYKQ